MGEERLGYFTDEKTHSSRKLQFRVMWKKFWSAHWESEREKRSLNWCDRGVTFTGEFSCGRKGQHSKASRPEAVASLPFHHGRERNILPGEERRCLIRSKRQGGAKTNRDQGCVEKALCENEGGGNWKLLSWGQWEMDSLTENYRVSFTQIYLHPIPSWITDLSWWRDLHNSMKL